MVVSSSSLTRCDSIVEHEHWHLGYLGYGGRDPSGPLKKQGNQVAKVPGKENF